MEPLQALPVALKLQVEVELDGKPLKITAQVEGEGEAARRAAAEISSAIAAAISRTTTLVPSDGLVPDAGPVEPLTALSIEASQTSAPAVVISDTPKAQAVRPSPMAAWVQINRTRINLGVGGVLLALAVIIPIIVPANQRSDVLIMTILFSLTGALLLFTATLPGRNSDAVEKQVGPIVRQPSVRNTSPSRLQPQTPTKVKPIKAGWGIALGAAFVLAGFIAPFILGITTADERFIIMLGFAPVVVVGFFMIAIFGRSLFKFPQSSTNLAEVMPKPAGGIATVKRAPVARVPQNLEYKAIVPAAIAGLLIVMVVVVGLVIAATVASVVR